MNFAKDLREQITQLLKEDNIAFNKQDSTCGLLISYLNTLNRRIPVKKRKVFISDNVRRVVDDNKLNEEYINALLKFKCNFENGIDMTGHLSTSIFSSNSKDYLLDDWGIHHIHLRDKKAKNKQEMYSDKNDKEKGNRSIYLLFIKVTDSEVYFIDILNHNDKNVFAMQELLDTLERNWSFLLQEYNIPDVYSVSKLTNEEVNNGRKNGGYKLYYINKKAYRPMGGGLTSAGTNIIHTENADRILDDMREIEEYFRNNYMDIKNEVEVITETKCLEENLEFKFFLDLKGYVVKEINTGYAILFFYEGNYFKKRVGIVKDKC